MKRLAWVVVLALISLPRPFAASAASMCDPDIASLVDTTSEARYKDRGNRCEGLFVKQVAGEGSLLLASLTAGTPKVGPAHTWLTWKNPGGTPVHIRAYSLRQRLYFRMDTTPLGGATRYDWATDFATRLHAAPSNVGIVAWSRSTVGSRHEDVFTPLAVGASTGPPQSSGKTELTVIPGVELTELHVTVTRLKPQGGVQKQLRSASELGYGYYPAGTAVRIPLDELTDAGLYVVDLSGDAKDGGPVVAQFFIAI